MIESIDRNYLEIKSIKDLIESNSPKLECSINLVEPDDFQIMANTKIGQVESLLKVP